MINCKWNLEEMTVFILILIQGSLADYAIFRDLAQNIQDEFRPHQTIVMHDGEAENSNVANEILQGTTSGYPVRVLNYLKENPEHLQSSVASRSFQETTLFISIQTEATADSGKGPLSFLRSVSGSSTRPKCLLVFLGRLKKKYPESLLRDGWKKQFLDLTILEVVEQRENLDQNLSWNQYPLHGVLHYLNPFNNTCIERIFTKEESIFPNKLLDLKGFGMKVTSCPDPPHVLIKYDRHGHPVDISGPQAEIVKVLSEVQNSRLFEVPAEIDSAAVVVTMKCMHIAPDMLRRSESQFITNHYIMSNVDSYQGNRIMVIFIPGMRDRYFALVPILRSPTVNISITKTSLCMGLITCILLILIWSIFRFFGFDILFWQPLYFVGMLLGHPVPRDVAKLPDRVALAFVVIGFWLFSSTFYSILTDTQFIKPDDSINSLEDLHKSELKPLLSWRLRSLMSWKGRSPTVLGLLQKSCTYNKSSDCIDLLLLHKNVSCILNEANARAIMKEHSSKNAIPKMKILEVPFLDAFPTMMFKKSSPYALEFERRLWRLSESGLITKWFGGIRTPVREGVPKENSGNLVGNQSDLLFRLLLILGVGYGISILFLFEELLARYIEDRFNCKINFL